MRKLSTQLLVIGGGATGLGVAWDACLRGLSVVLVEQGDLGQGTSGRYHGLLHSGGRYVVSDPTSARDCAAENAVLRRIAPHTIEDTGGLFVATPGDPPEFAAQWLAGCRETGVEADEIDVGAALRREPALNPRLVRAFLVADAALDSFDLLHALARSIRGCWGEVWLRHRVERLIVERGRVAGVEVISLPTGERTVVEAGWVVNAAGPWAGQVVGMAGAKLPIGLGKGSMIAMTTRPVHTVINRCRPPTDGDAIVPVGTVAVIGTTDTPVEEPDDVRIEPWEIDLLMTEGEAVIPGLSAHRALRAWAGVRPLYRPEGAGTDQTRALPRAHMIVDHGERDGIGGLVSVFGGKLTTYRLMAEQVVDLICRRAGVEAVCRTAETPLDGAGRTYHTLPARWAEVESAAPPDSPPQVVCECELVRRTDLEAALGAADTASLDDVRRDLRLGMGPCQASFCAYRAAGIAHEVLESPPEDGGLVDFLGERWRGIRPLGWGHTLRQMELMRRVYVEILHVEALAAERER